jgi:hypothetical protein
MLYNIYIIRNNIDDIVYVGKTSRSINRRFLEHRSRYNCYKSSHNARHRHNYNYCSSFELFQRYGAENCYVELYSQHDCSHIESLKYEQQVINELKGRVVNQLQAFDNKNTINYYRRKLFKYLKAIHDARYRYDVIAYDLQ